MSDELYNWSFVTRISCIIGAWPKDSCIQAWWSGVGTLVSVGCSFTLPCSQCQRLLGSWQIYRGAYSVQCISPVFISRKRSWFLGLCRTHIVPQVGNPSIGLIVCWLVVWLFGISTFVDYLVPNPFLYK